MDREELVNILEDYARKRGERLSIILVGANALPFYGVQTRYTRDIDAEVLEGDLYRLKEFLDSMGVESDLTENFSGWSIVSMPSDYRERAVKVYESPHLVVKVLEPHDFILAKLRRGTQQDIEDALKVARTVDSFNREELKRRIDRAIRESPRDTQILNFKRICEHFFSLLSAEPP